MNFQKKLIKNYSEYLSFRSFFTDHPVQKSKSRVVQDAEEAIDYLKGRLSDLEDAAILLSGGMDSAILLPFMPKSTTAYTIYHDNLEEDSEVEIARKYCEKFGIKHKAIAIKPQNYLDSMDALMINKKMPLSPAEPIFYLASKVAVEDGFKRVITGAGADTCHGGFIKHRRKYTISSYIKRLARAYVSPKATLNNFSDTSHVFKDYLKPTSISDHTLRTFFESLVASPGNKGLLDSRNFLRDIGFERFAYDNAITFAGAEHISPLKEIYYDFNEKKNLKRPKYFIEDIYEGIYGYLPPKKLGLQKPSFLLNDYKPSNFDLFKKDFNTKNLPYPKKFLIYSLERFEQLRLDGKIDLDN